MFERVGRGMTVSGPGFPGQLFNLYKDIPEASAGEVVDTLLDDPDVRIERIVSHGHSSPPGFWYEQNQDEWVLVLKGNAILEFAGGRTVAMEEGDSLLIHAGEKHRVAFTSSEPACVWLCVFID